MKEQNGLPVPYGIEEPRPVLPPAPRKKRNGITEGLSRMKSEFDVAMTPVSIPVVEPPITPRRLFNLNE